MRNVAGPEHGRGRHSRLHPAYALLAGDVTMEADRFDTADREQGC